MLDSQLARQAAEQIGRDLAYSHRLVVVAVHGGWVTLAGDVEWNYQKNAAEMAVRRDPCVKGITNGIRVRPRIEPAELRRHLEAALQGCAAGSDSAPVRAWAERAARGR